MVKKSIIALALICMFASFSYGIDGQPNGQVKIDGLWPGEVIFKYNKLELCKIPVHIDIGMFIEIIGCDGAEIVMEQISCTGNHKFPCYRGCVELEAHANFEAELSISGQILNTDIIKGGNWKAYFLDPLDPGYGDFTAPQKSTFLVPSDGNSVEIAVCFEAWDANIFNAAPGVVDNVALVIIKAIPTTLPNCEDYTDWCP